LQPSVTRLGSSRTALLAGIGQKEPDMLIIGPQGVEQAKAAIVVGAIALVAFWRFILHLVLALIAIAIIVVIGAGAVVLLQK
jgi:hypothetical protein